LKKDKKNAVKKVLSRILNRVKGVGSIGTEQGSGHGARVWRSNPRESTKRFKICR
jgi:hypothetical protein